MKCDAYKQEMITIERYVYTGSKNLLWPQSHPQVAMKTGNPFGMVMEDRQYTAGAYRYGFGGQEKDDEMKGDGNSYDFGARIFDPRLGKWLSLDPMVRERSWMSPYNFVQNNPINRIDPTGALDGWIEDDKGNVSWDENTNSQEEFDKNYAGKEGYSYVSDADNPNSYTLPNGIGKLVVNEWKTYKIDRGAGPSILLEFIPSDTDNKSGWFQTYSSNIPDVHSENVSVALPQENVEERLDGTFENDEDKKDPTKAVYYTTSNNNILSDMPLRQFNPGAERSVVWKAQSSVISNGGRLFSVGWGFTIDSENSGTYHSPTILNSVSDFHKTGIKNLKQ